MKQALVDQVTASIAAGPYVFRASGSSVKFPGFMALYRAEEDDGDGNGDKAREQLPELKEGQRSRCTASSRSSTSRSPLRASRRPRW